VLATKFEGRYFGNDFTVVHNLGTESIAVQVLDFQGFPVYRYALTINSLNHIHIRMGYHNVIGEPAYAGGTPGVGGNFEWVDANDAFDTYTVTVIA
jgi:hypothetical protein